MSKVNRQWRLAARPEGLAGDDHFQWVEQAVPEPGPGQARVRVLWLSLDPTNRPWMWSEDTYLPAQALGDVMRGVAIGRVEASQRPDLPEGCLVSGLLGWQDYCLVGAGDRVGRLPEIPDLPLSTRMALLGHIGLTAWFGIHDVGRVRAGETVLVSGAAGAVGSLAGQGARLAGARVVGIAGTADKCEWITGELGFAGAIDYRAQSVPEALDRLCPEGVDVYFDNVGGTLLEMVLERIRLRGRVAVCGMISQYNAPGGRASAPGPRNLFQLVVRRARMEGFLASDYAGRAAEAYEPLLEGYRAGRIRVREHVIEGLEQAPAAMNRLFDGTHRGKLMVRVA